MGRGTHTGTACSPGRCQTPPHVHNRWCGSRLTQRSVSPPAATAQDVPAARPRWRRHTQAKHAQHEGARQEQAWACRGWARGPCVVAGCSPNALAPRTVSVCLPHTRTGSSGCAARTISTGVVSTTFSGSCSCRKADLARVAGGGRPPPPGAASPGASVSARATSRPTPAKVTAMTARVEHGGHPCQATRARVSPLPPEPSFAGAPPVPSRSAACPPLPVPRYRLPRTALPARSFPLGLSRANSRCNSVALRGGWPMPSGSGLSVSSGAYCCLLRGLRRRRAGVSADNGNGERSAYGRGGYGKSSAAWPACCSCTIIGVIGTSIAYAHRPRPPAQPPCHAAGTDRVSGAVLSEWGDESLLLSALLLEVAGEYASATGELLTVREAPALASCVRRRRRRGESVGEGAGAAELQTAGSSPLLGSCQGAASRPRWLGGIEPRDRRCVQLSQGTQGK